MQKFLNSFILKCKKRHNCHDNRSQIQSSSTNWTRNIFYSENCKFTNHCGWGVWTTAHGITFIMVQFEEIKQKAFLSDNKLLHKEFTRYLQNLLFLTTGIHPCCGRRITNFFFLVGSTCKRLFRDTSNPSGNAAPLTQDSTACKTALISTRIIFRLTWWEYVHTGWLEGCMLDSDAGCARVLWKQSLE